ncbi:hypothetical protein KSZ12_03715 [Parabacteroides distasonis]|nr:hypothetical protein [Parabacteroides distasonis]MBV4224957.1 hypothetical protein [Parabacteroides distasonis]
MRENMTLATSSTMFPTMSMMLYSDRNSAHSSISLQVNSWATTVITPNVCRMDIRFSLYARTSISDMPRNMQFSMSGNLSYGPDSPVRFTTRPVISVSEYRMNVIICCPASCNGSFPTVGNILENMA